MVSQTKKSKISLAMLFLNLSKIRKKESQAVDSLVLQLFGQLASLLKSTNKLFLENLAKKFQKQTKLLGRCGLIPHYSFYPLLLLWTQSLVSREHKQATASQPFFQSHLLVALLCIPLTTISIVIITNQKKNVLNGGLAWPSLHFLSLHGLPSLVLQPFFQLT